MSALMCFLSLADFDLVRIRLKTVVDSSWLS